MIKFIVTDNTPTELKKGEFVLKKPDFLTEVVANANKAPKGPKGTLTGINQLRYIVDSIGMKYDSAGTNGWSVKPHLYEGRPYSNNEDLSKIVVEMLEKCHPSIFRKYVEFAINNLPPGTETLFIEDFKVPGSVTPLFEKGFVQSYQEELSKQVSEKTKKNQKVSLQNQES
jgi:hypothetical protein